MSVNVYRVYIEPEALGDLQAAVQEDYGRMDSKDSLAVVLVVCEYLGVPRVCHVPFSLTASASLSGMLVSHLAARPRIGSQN